MPKNKKILPLLGLLAFLLLVLGAQIYKHNVHYKDSIFPGIYLNGQNYGGLSKADAKALLEQQAAEAYNSKIKFVYEDKIFEIGSSEIGIAIDAEKTAEELCSYGHRKNLLDSAKEQFNLLQRNVDFRNEIGSKNFLVEESKWDEIAKIEAPAQNFSYKWNGKDFVAVEAQEGFVIDKDGLRKNIENNLKNLRNDSIQIELVKNTPDIDKDQDGLALAQARELIQKEVILKSDSGSWKVSRDDFGNWIDFAAEKNGENNSSLVLATNKAEINKYLVTLAPQINREPINAQLEFKNGKVGVFALSQDGIKIDLDKSVEKINAQVLQNNAGVSTNNKKTANTQASSSNQIIVELAVNKVAPELATQNIDNMGITTLLATGESDFRGSTTSRKHNITVGASKFQGILIGPGDTFSFNKILGNVGAKEGYLPELVIKQGKTIPEYGGGLCQVSTTAFRGAVRAGLQITQRTNHAYAVKYYDPQGTDATIYPPNPDLAFVNNTPAYILIQTRISGTKLYFDYYGTNDGRKVTLEGPAIYERGAAGAMKTWWKQSVYNKEGKLFLEKTFYSNYKSPSLYPHTNPLE